MINAIQDMQSVIKSINFPIGKDDMVEVARDKGAPDQVIELIEQFTDKEYRNEDEIKEEAAKQTSSGGLSDLL